MHTITEAEKQLLDAAKNLVRRYGVNNGKLIIIEAERKTTEEKFKEFVILGKSITENS